MKKRILSLLLAFAMVFGLIPSTAFAGGAATVNVDFTSQAAGAFLHAPQFGAEVSSGLAESYGYTDSVEDGVSALDVLVKAHEITFGEDFTEETAEDYLVVSDGSVSKLFGEETSANGFAVNGTYPHDGTESPYGGYNGTTVSTHEITDGDLVEFFIYQDTNDWCDELAWISFNGCDVTELTVAPAYEAELTVSGVSYVWYGYMSENKEALHAFGSAREGAQLAWVDVSENTVNDIDGAETDENGLVTVTMPEEKGTYYLTAYMPENEITENYASPMIMSLTKVIVNADAVMPQYGDCDLTALSVTGLHKNPVALNMTPEFSSDVTEYTAETAAYDDSLGFLYIKAAAYNEDAVITAKCNEKSATVTSGDSDWTLIGMGALKPGSDNTVTVTVAASADENAEKKIYTVTVPMAPDPDSPTLKGESSGFGVIAAGDTYELDLGTIFEDDNHNDSLTYKVSVNGAEALGAEKAYRFEPDETGTYTLKFTAYDGVKASPVYTLTLTVMTQSELTEARAKEVLDNIAAKYAESGVVGDSNAPWFAADMMAYLNTYPDTEHKLTESQKLAMAEFAIGKIKTTSSVSEAAKYTLSLAAMGYDPERVIDFAGEECNFVEEYFIPLCFGETGEITNSAKNEYTLPYVLIAFRQFGNKYGSEIEKLVAAALETESRWTNVQWGTDGATPMMLALAPYYGTNADVKAALDRAHAIVKGVQVEDGAIGNTASTGLSMAAFAALGEDPAKVKHGTTGKSLLDGLMTSASASNDGFTGGYGSFFNEQGMRGLLAWANMQKPDTERYYLYDFSGQELVPVKDIQPEVRFSVVPEGATVTVKHGDTVQETAVPYNYDLEAGEYTYTVEKDGYITKSGNFTVTSEDVEANETQIIHVSLVSAPPENTDRTITVSVKVLTHDDARCEGKWTYKNNTSEYTIKLADMTAELKSGQTAFDALALALDSAGISYTEKTYNYISEIAGIEEFGHSSRNSGWLYMVDGEVVQVGCRDYLITSDANIIWFYTDDYTEEYGSEEFGGGVSAVNAVDAVEKLIDAIGNVTLGSKQAIEEAREAYDNLTAAQKKLVNNYDVLLSAEAAYEKLVTAESLPFTDVSGHWGMDAVKYVYDNKLMDGTSDTLFEPDVKLSRAMLVTVLYRLAGNPNVSTGDITDFNDVSEKDMPWAADAVKWAASVGITIGYDGDFRPKDNITREQAAVMLYRYAEFARCDLSSGEDTDIFTFSDAGDISQWAVDAMKWAVSSGIFEGDGSGLINPKGDASRAEIAMMIMRFAENVVK